MVLGGEPPPAAAAWSGDELGQVEVGGQRAEAGSTVRPLRFLSLVQDERSVAAGADLLDYQMLHIDGLPAIPPASPLKFF